MLRVVMVEERFVNNEHSTPSFMSVHAMSIPINTEQIRFSSHARIFVFSLTYLLDMYT